MVSFPVCKINLGLYVLARRDDGYHAIETCFYPVPWSDRLEINVSTEFRFLSDGLEIPGKWETNSCISAWKMLSKDFTLPPVEILLQKNIPAGAGLGGGSSDGVGVVKLANEMFDLKLTEKMLVNYANRLGSDCAFFVNSVAQLGTGRGELLSPLDLALDGKTIVIIKPEVHISTSEAYRNIVPHTGRKDLREIVAMPVERWRGQLVNDFEAWVFKKYPVIADVKTAFYSNGAVYASLSGSGAAVFGIFDKEPDLGNSFGGMTMWSGQL